MEQIGVVKKTEENIAFVTVNRVSACGENCAHCKGGCTPSSVTAKVENPVGAAVGDRVKIETDTNKVLFASFILYIVPVLLTILAAIITAAVTKETPVLIFVSALVFFGAFFLIHKWDKTLAPTPVITKIIGKTINQKDVN